MATIAALSRIPLKTGALLSTIDHLQNAAMQGKVSVCAPHQHMSCAMRWLRRSQALRWLSQQHLPWACPTQGAVDQRQSCQDRPKV